MTDDLSDGSQATVYQWRRLLELQRPVLSERCAAILPGATSAQLRAVERVLGFSLPDSYKAVLRESAGGMPLPNQPGMADLERLLEDWAVWVDVAGRSEDGVDDIDPDCLATKKTRGFYCHARLISLCAESGHGEPMLDMSPGPAGRVGQVVSVRHGEGMCWHAWSLAAYFKSFADAIEQGRVSYHPNDCRWLNVEPAAQSWRDPFRATEE